MQYFYYANSLQIEFRTAETRNLKSSRDITCDRVVMLPLFSLPFRRLSRYIPREKRIARTPDHVPQISLRSPGSMLPTW